MLVYKRGVGWVEEPEGLIITLACGTRVRLEPRTPLHGERYRKNAKLYLNNNVPHEEWLRFIRNTRFLDALVGIDDNPYLDYVYLVMVPC